MLKFKINVADALDRVGFGVYDAKKTGFISQETLKRLRAEDTRVTLAALNKLCILLDMELKDVIIWEMEETEAEERAEIIGDIKKRKSRRKPYDK